MANLEKDIERFIRQQLFRERETPLVRFTLAHAAAGSKGVTVETFDVSDKEFGEDSVVHLVGDILMRARSDADGMGGLQRYAVSAFESGGKSPVARFSFRLEGGSEEGTEFSGDGEEAANNQGLLKQLMRHNEANTRTVAQGWGMLVGGLTRRVESQDKLIEKLLEKHFDGLELLERARSEENEREIRLLEAAGSEKRTDAIFEKISVLFPVVLNKLAGSKIVDAEDPTILMVKGFAESLTHEQLQKIAATLQPEQTIALFQVLQVVKPKQLDDGSNGANGKGD